MTGGIRGIGRLFGLGNKTKILKSLPEMDNDIRRAEYNKNEAEENIEYYKDYKSCKTLDFTGRFKTFLVTGFTK